MDANVPAKGQGVVEDGLVTVAEAGQFLGLSRAMVYRLMEEGKLPFAKIGAARRVPRRSLVALAEASLVGG
jgi:excisionase family DNA binding protein